jgi:5-phospho-D-xylono-1,4-lactonase
LSENPAGTDTVASFDQSGGIVRTVLGDRAAAPRGYIYAHEHLIIDSPFIEVAFPHIRLDSVSSAVEELTECASAGVGLALDCMPCAAGRDVRRLAQISNLSGVEIVAATGLHHDRYYGTLHWSNHVTEETLADLFVEDLETGIDRFDYSGPVIQRTPHRAGFVKIATSGAQLDTRDRRNLRAGSEASKRTGAPIVTHCEAGLGGLEQIDFLVSQGVSPEALILSHVDKSGDLAYLRDLAQSGAVLELDQWLRHYESGVSSASVRAVEYLVGEGYQSQIVVGTDGARRSLWNSLGGRPGLAWLARSVPDLLARVGLPAQIISAVLRDNAARALAWHHPAMAAPGH